MRPTRACEHHARAGHQLPSLRLVLVGTRGAALPALAASRLLRDRRGFDGRAVPLHANPTADPEGRVPGSCAAGPGCSASPLSQHAPKMSERLTAVQSLAVGLVIAASVGAAV